MMRSPAEAVGLNESLGRAHLAQCLRPLAHHDLPIHLFFFLPSNRTGSPKCSLLPILPDRDARLPSLFSPRVPRHLIHFIEGNGAVLPLVSLHHSTNAYHP